jgi:hypothetical protein
MEPSGATGSNQWQMERQRKPRNQAKTVAVGCHRLPEIFHGKEGVDGSSPSEGSILQEVPANRPVLLSWQASQSTSLGRPDHVELAAPSAKCLQIDLLTGTTEHLSEKEGIGAIGRQTASKRAANPRHSGTAGGRIGQMGTSLGDRSPVVHGRVQWPAACASAEGVWRPPLDDLGCGCC